MESEPRDTRYIYCRYCDWKTLRFRGKKRVEQLLRIHVVDTHEEEYLAAQGLASVTDEYQWHGDHIEIGEQAL